MINIISKSFCCPYTTGPGKVVKNLIKGLDMLKYPYVINKNPSFGDLLWIHDDASVLDYLQRSKTDIKAVIGPNIVFGGNNLGLNYNNLVLLQPSDWSKNFCLKYRFSKSPIEVWPVGIDTDLFSLEKKRKRDLVLIYFKQRYKDELSLVVNLLESKNISYKVIIYGRYSQNDYIDTLKKTKYIIWIGRQESQGIALQEALASNVPIIVWDVPYLGYWVPSTEKEKKMFSEVEQQFQGATVVPFFDNRCGFKLLNFEDLSDKVDTMESGYLKFEPVLYIKDNLSLEGQAQELLNIFKKHNLTNKSGVSKKKWRNNFLCSYMFRIKKLFKFVNPSLWQRPQGVLELLRTDGKNSL